MNARCFVVAAALLATLACACALAAEAEPKGGLVLVRARTVGGASDTIASGPYTATISVAQHDAPAGIASGGKFAATGGVIAQQSRADLVFADSFE